MSRPTGPATGILYMVFSGLMALFSFGTGNIIGAIAGSVLFLAGLMMALAGWSNREE